MKKNYMLMGDPLPLSKMKGSKAAFWNEIANQKFAWQMQVDEQQGELPLFNRPILLEIHFYFNPQTSKYTDRLKGRYYESRPSLEDLLRGLLSILDGRVYKPGCMIVSLQAFKKYDKIPRTELACVEIE